MVMSKFAYVGIAALAAMLGAPIWQPVRAEETAKQPTSESATCPRPTFRVVIDVGHTATSPGADSARGVHEYEFNLRLADAVLESLRDAQFDRTVRLITGGARLSSLFHRVVSAEHLQPDLFLSIHHDSVPDHLKEAWQYEGKKHFYSDRFSGYAIFVSNQNSDRVGSLAFAHSLGQELQKRGLHYTPHYTFPVMGRYRRELVDEQAGVYGYDHLVVLRKSRMPAVLLEAGSIVNREEELELATPERRNIVAEAVTAAVVEFCASQSHTVADRPASYSFGSSVNAPSQRAKPASFSR
jgi:N-acetylmuramoyl-L-alanine amidase